MESIPLVVLQALEARSSSHVVHSIFDVNVWAERLPRALYEKARDGLGMTPAAYQRGAAGIGIRYALGEVPLGRVLVAKTRVGVCTVLLGAENDSLLDDLSHEFPGAILSLEGRMPSPWGDAVRRAQREDPLLLRLPSSTRRDVFQAKVWKVVALS